MYQENESKGSGGGGGYQADPAQLQLTRRDLHQAWRRYIVVLYYE